MTKLRWILCIALLGAVLLPAPAFAQLTTSSSPPPVIMTDSNGVDLKSGRFVTTSTPLGAGAADNPAISYAQLDFNFNNNAGTPLIGWIQHYTCGISDPDLGGCNEYLVARLGNQTLTFGRAPGQYNLTAFTREQLVSDPVLGGMTIYDNEDTAWVFDGGFSGPGTFNEIIQAGRLRKIIYRDGRTLTYAYAAPPSTDMTVTSNQGYQLIVRNGHNEVRLVNTSVDLCDINAPSCTYSQSWPTFTRTVSGDWQVATFIYSDPMSRSTTIQRHSTGNSYIIRPGGLYQTIQERNVQLWIDCSGIECANEVAMVVTNYSDQLGSATYTYSGIPYRGGITHAVAAHSDGSQLTYDSLELGSQDRITNELGHATTYGFNGTDMQPWSYDFVEGNLRSVMNPEQASQFWYRDGMANIIQSTVAPKPGSGQSPISSTASFNTSCVNGRTCHLPDYTIDARSARTDYTYDPNSGMRLTETLPPDEDDIRRETRYTWQPLQAVYKQSPTGPAVPSGSPIWMLMATSTCRTMAGDDCVGMADEVRTSYTYNGNLLPTSVTTRAGDNSLVSTVTREYDIHGNVLWVDGPAAGTVDRTYFFWNANREPIGEIGPDPDGSGPTQPLPFAATRRQFDSEGRVTEVATGSATAQTLAALNAMTVHVIRSTTYDMRGRKLTDRSSGGAAQTLVQYSYGYKGLLECTAVRMNPAAYGSLPASACTPGTPGSHGPDRITKNIYDAAGRLIQVRRAVATPDEQAYATYSYSPNGMVTSVIDANGNRASMIYDGFDRQRRWIFPSPTIFPSPAHPLAFNPATPATAEATAGAVNPDDDEQYDYDANGNRTSFTRRDNSTLTFQYDQLNRMIVKVVPERAGLPTNRTRDVYYEYDLLGHQIHARFDSDTGVGVTSNYDALGRMIWSEINMSGVTRRLNYAHDLSGNRTQLTLPLPGLNFFAYDYDAANRLIGIRENGGTTIAGFTYNDRGRPWQVNFNGAAMTYTYDGILRLASLSNGLLGTGADHNLTFGYNAASQIVTRTASNDAYVSNVAYNVGRNYARNGLNQYSSISTVGGDTLTLDHDDNGNLISDGSSNYVYDVENRLVVASGVHTAELYYDPLGRLQTSVGSTGTTRFLYDGDELVAQYDGSNILQHRYIHGLGTDDPIIWYEGSDLTTRRSLFANHQGSIVAVADANGNAVAINGYDSWGIRNAGNLGRFQFTGQIWMPEIGMYYYKARIYSPTLGRFLQTDPVGYDDQINLYAYVANDPVNATDPDGQQAVWEMQAEEEEFDRSLQGQTPSQIREAVLSRSTSRLEIMANFATFAIPGAVGIRAGIIVAKAVALTRIAGRYLPAATRTAALQRFNFVRSALSSLARGGGRIIIGPGSRTGVPMREAANYASRYGGEATDYAKVSITTVTASGERVSVHAVRNLETGRIYDPKLLIGR